MEIPNQKFMENYYFSTIIKCSLLFVLIVLAGCNDIFEKNISKGQVLMIIPKNSDTLASNQVHFKWEMLDGAEAYELHIVRPSFEIIDNYVLDSAVQGDEFKLILSPGEYAFKVRAINSAYQSEFTPNYTFVVDSITDLSEQVIQLVSPENDFYTNNGTISLFTWQNLFFADFYIFQIWNGENFGNTSLLYQQSNIFGVNYSFAQSSSIVLEEGIYSWGVSAANDASTSDFSTRNIFVDMTRPNNPDIIFPLTNYVSASNQVTLSWTKNGADVGLVNSPVFSNVEISEGDSLFSDATTVEILDIPVDSLLRVFTISGEYWWRVYLSDKAGNESEFYSTAEKFTIP